MVQHVKNPPAMQEVQPAQVQSLGWEVPLEKEMAAHSNILPRNIPWTEEPGRLEFITPLDVSKGCEAFCPEVVEDYGFL